MLIQTLLIGCDQNRVVAAQARDILKILLEGVLSHHRKKTEEILHGVYDKNVAFLEFMFSGYKLQSLRLCSYKTLDSQIALLITISEHTLLALRNQERYYRFTFLTMASSLHRLFSDLQQLWTGDVREHVFQRASRTIHLIHAAITTPKYVTYSSAHSNFLSYGETTPPKSKNDNTRVALLNSSELFFSNTEFTPNVVALQLLLNRFNVVTGFHQKHPNLSLTYPLNLWVKLVQKEENTSASLENIKETELISFSVIAEVRAEALPSWINRDYVFAHTKPSNVAPAKTIRLDVHEIDGHGRVEYVGPDNEKQQVWIDDKGSSLLRTLSRIHANIIHTFGEEAVKNKDMKALTHEMARGILLAFCQWFEDHKHTLELSDGRQFFDFQQSAHLGKIGTRVAAAWQASRNMYQTLRQAKDAEASKQAPTSSSETDKQAPTSSSVSDEQGIAHMLKSKTPQRPVSLGQYVAPQTHGSVLAETSN